MARMQGTFLGTGTSAGIPVLLCDCPVCTSADPLNRRLRTSFWLRGEGRSVLIDCGPDFREQALAARIPRIDTLLLTHSHSDHTVGIDDLRLYNFAQGGAIPVHGSGETLEDVRRRFDYCFKSGVQQGGGIPQLDLVPVEGPFRAARLAVVPVPLFHGRLPILGFRFGKFAYLTDVSRIPDESWALLEGVETLVLNALRHRPHPTHFTVDEAVAAAERIGAARTWFVHMTHDLDHAETNAKLPPDKQLARDGLTIDVDVELAP
ncbi:MAG: MBL fold metallo-hydrolase [Candidatus Sumerlaeia bacterium]|nr:MBL fold metallo-hydrolase [Candidatus Sumerlaeia bacterium]